LRDDVGNRRTNIVRARTHRSEGGRLRCVEAALRLEHLIDILLGPLADAVRAAIA
jgi:hypothetical protein